MFFGVSYRDLKNIPQERLCHAEAKAHPPQYDIHGGHCGLHRHLLPAWSSSLCCSHLLHGGGRPFDEGRFSCLTRLLVWLAFLRNLVSGLFLVMLLLLFFNKNNALQLNFICPWLPWVSGIPYFWPPVCCPLGKGNRDRILLAPSFEHTSSQVPRVLLEKTISFCHQGVLGCFGMF